MSDAKQIIDINGKRYDAQTGKLLGGVNGHSNHPANPKPQQQNGAAIDGFVRRQGIPRSNPQPASKQSRPVQKSQTLMRPGVEKPKPEAPKPKESQQPRPQLAKASHHRINRAKTVQKSAHVSKFGHGHLVPNKVIKKSANLDVASPKHQGKLAKTTEQFEQAMHSATSHLEDFVPDSKSSRSKRFVFGSLAAVSVMVLGFLAWQMVPSIKVKYAGTRAGFSANLPDYNPAGFGLSGNVESASGEVGLTYNSHTDDKSYKIKQTPSNWTSQSLLTNYVIPTYGANNYQVYESQGKTIYIKDNSNASWVDGGIWYQLEGNATLTSDQLQRIVNSL